ncbi:MAG: carbohydrate ABC transporter permease [Provencibacterium sp.]|jgi:putative aldouronate transport system permease protein|nr:carbohydrate ABC transporter permease [Provencibacterium sp.]
MLRTKGEKAFEAVNIVLLSILVLVTAYPLYYVLAASFSNPAEIMKHTGVLWGLKGFSLESYKYVFRYPMVWIGYGNTLVYVLVGTAVNTLFTALAAYGLSRKNAMLCNFFMVLITVTMFFSGGLIPTYLLVDNMGLTNTRLVMFIWKMAQPYNLIVMRTSFREIPDSLIESATIDGANHFQIFWKIAVPVSKAVLFVIILFYGVYHWNAWFYAMVFLRSKSLYPLQIVLRDILVANDVSAMTEGMVGMDEKEMIGATIKYAIIVVSTVPILCVYPFIQKHFVKGVMVGAIKG